MFSLGAVPYDLLNGVPTFLHTIIRFCNYSGITGKEELAEYHNLITGTGDYRNKYQEDKCLLVWGTY